MSNNNDNQTNPWMNLSTITTFDTGNTAWTTRRLEEIHDGASGGGQIVGRVGPSTSLLIESLIKSICTMLESDSARRDKLYSFLCDKLHGMKLIESSYNMMEFEGIRGQYQQAWYQLVTAARAAAGGDSIIEISNPTDTVPETSRYAHDFHELEFIASGGFANVYRALHRLDGHEYAIKKIIVRSSRVKTIVQQLKEVKSLAKLNHTNIVAYKAAWFEYDLPRSLNSRCLMEKGTRQSSRRSKKSGKSSVSCVESLTNLSSSNQLSSSSSKPAAGTKVDEIIATAEKQNSDTVSFRNDDDDDNYDKSVSSGYSYEIGEINYDERNTTDADQPIDGRICQYNSSTLRSQFATLYIQMALCEKTLRAWLDERLEVTPEPITTMILTQILDGLHYIHSRRTVHHDIKPSNIFISASGQRVEIQLGDFGLACPLQRESHHPVLGTELYAAPEQLNGQCDPKSDLYSLGIVIFEILFPMKTHMERNFLINKLKCGKIPDNIVEEYPKWAEIIKTLVHADPKRRPSTIDLLQDLAQNKDILITKLRNNDKRQQLMIEDLKRENEELREELDKLKATINKQIP